MTFLENFRHRLAACFMQQDMADNQVETRVFETGFLGIHLREVYVMTKYGRTRVGVADKWLSNVDAPYLCIGKYFLERQGGVTHRAAHVQNALWCKAVEVTADIIADRATFVVVERAAKSH